MGVFAALFLITFVVGLAVLIGTAVFGELEIGDGDGPFGGLLSVTSASTLLFGWGEVTFLDEDGALTAAKAITAEPAGIAAGQEIYIADVDADVVHVVAITPM